MTTQYNAIEWAREHGEGFHWACLANAYSESDRRSETASGYVYTYSNEQTHGETRIILTVDEGTELRDITESLYLMDDATTVTPYYVGGWRYADGQASGRIEYLMLMPFPTFAKTGFDFTSWRLTPRRAYHVKMRRA